MIRSIGLPCRATDASQVRAKTELGKDLPGFYLELVLPSDDLERWSTFVLNQAQKQSIPWKVVHAPFVSRDLIHTDQVGLATTAGLRRLNGAAVLAKELGAKLVVHDDDYEWVRTDTATLEALREQMWPIAVQNLKALKSVCPKVMVENLTELPWGDCGDMETINLFHTEGAMVGELARQAGVGVVFDLAHSCSIITPLSSPLAVAQSIGLDLIRHLHIASFGRQNGEIPYLEGLPLGQGMVRPDHLRDLLEVLPPDICATVEVNEPSYTLLPNARVSLDWLRRYEFI